MGGGRLGTPCPKQSAGEGCVGARRDTVTHLSLSGCGVGPEGAQHVAALLKATQHLATLDLNVNHLGDDGALALAQALRENHSLAELFLYGNGISVVGVLLSAIHWGGEGEGMRCCAEPLGMLGPEG